MSTRSGDLDPGVVTYLARSERLSADQVEDLVSHRAGLLGISGTSGDMRTLLARETDDPDCQLAITAYVYAIKKAIGALAAALGGFDTLVFSGGIGEHAPTIRAVLVVTGDTTDLAKSVPFVKCASPLIRHLYRQPNPRDPATFQAA